MKALISQRECIDSHGTHTDVLESDYVKYFEKIGVEVWAVSNFTTNVNHLFDLAEWDFLILTGGGSVPREYYDFIALDEPQQENRDHVEELLVRQCLERKIPILAICRGMQFLNGLFGGKISRLDKLTVSRPVGSDHEVWCEAWHKYMIVNNFHNDGIKKNNLAKLFYILAEDQANQIVEGFYSDEWMVYGLQWHPERRFGTEKAKEESQLLIIDFIKKYVVKGLDKQ